MSDNAMVKIAIVIGSTRPNRKGPDVAKWAYELAKARTDATFELVDLKEVGLPLLDEPKPPSMGNYAHEYTKAWSAKVSGFDGFVFVTPEYNRAAPAALKNALDYLYKEWNDKAAGFIGYGSVGGVRAIENLRLVMGELQVADVRAAVSLFLATDWQDGAFKPAEKNQKALTTMLDQLVKWSKALATTRAS